MQSYKVWITMSMTPVLAATMAIVIGLLDLLATHLLPLKIQHHCCSVQNIHTC